MLAFLFENRRISPIFFSLNTSHSPPTPRTCLLCMGICLYGNHLEGQCPRLTLSCTYVCVGPGMEWGPGVSGMGVILMRNVRVGRLTAGWDTHVYGSPLPVQMWPQPFTATRPPSVSDSRIIIPTLTMKDITQETVICPRSPTRQQPQQD